MKMKGSAIVVVGTSAGGMEALIRLVKQLPGDFPAPILVVQHMAADTTGDVLVNSLRRAGKLVCKHPVNGESIQTGCIYVAPSDHHMLVEKGRILVTKGARENRSRPAIDPLFRSAAVTYGSKAIGVILTGYLDDGTSGLIAIHRCGGLCVIQDPKDAAYPDMPQNAMNNVKADYCLPLEEMGALLTRLVAVKARPSPPVPEDLAVESKIAKRVLSDLVSVGALGKQVPFNCPECGGVLWKIAKGNADRYRCHTGHAFTSSVLLAEQTVKIEETLWIALRMFEERKNLLQTLSEARTGRFSNSMAERARESQVHIDRIRAMLMSSDKATNGETEKIPRRS
ncbi:MAG: CheB methylesterase [Fibrobacteres bacterium]|nr:CheB methylesterase [Fibrobacterota bacterium]